MMGVDNVSLFTPVEDLFFHVIFSHLDLERTFNHLCPQLVATASFLGAEIFPQEGAWGN